ncbi:GNAT family N-acetyltransferase [Hoeflea poritis]|uniref:GNAT family N-acetyltransferase n=1 Tax=Hoeflea poritis TaxID=2993659 RepID=A0ABT4VKH5_9HYPH|nr:GNAT family N-acetyltransferase [Hoeflea poritis]MDA4845189.1 GNAT family N-acetyltransferase [Hoeflea poritis]
MERAELQTDRLRLRRWRETDIAGFARLCADPQVMKYIGNGETRTADQSERAVRKFEAEWRREGYGLFAVELRASGAFIGFAGLSTPDFLPEVMPAVEIGWRFDRMYWGNGYATEAATAALEFGRNARGLGPIVSICQTGNDASRRIMHKLGMVFDRQTVDPTCGRAVEVYRI